MKKFIESFKVVYEGIWDYNKGDDFKGSYQVSTITFNSTSAIVFINGHVMHDENNYTVNLYMNSKKISTSKTVIEHLNFTDTCVKTKYIFTLK